MDNTNNKRTDFWCELCGEHITNEPEPGLYALCLSCVSEDEQKAIAKALGHSKED